MSLGIPDFWKLLIQSQLLTHEQCQHLNSKFAQSIDQGEAKGKTLAEWLVRQKILTKYQAKILLAGRPGPFLYGDYKIYDRVEAGRLTGIFRAVHAATNHPVLLKFLAGPVTQSPQAWAELNRWIPLTAHPNVSRCYEAIDLGSFKFLVFEDLRGQSWTDLLETAKRVAPDEASRMGKLVATGLSWIHQNGRVHGDIRPLNLWLESNGNVKLLVEPDVGTRNFNISTAESEPDGLIRSDYAAPEFMQPGRLPDAFTDIYAVGATLYHMMAGQPPFAGGDVQTKLRRHATEAIRPLDTVGVPAPLMQLISYAMAKNPAVRYQQISVVGDQLGPFIGAAQHNFRPMAAPQSLAAYESWLQQKLATAAQPAVEMPAFVPGVASAGSTTAVSPDLVNVSTAPRTSSAAMAIRRKARIRQRKNIISMILIVLVFVAVVVGGVAIMNRTAGPSSANSKSKNAKGTPPSEPTAKAPKQAPASEGDDENPASPPEPPLANEKSSTRRSNNPLLVNNMAPMTANLDDGQLLWAAPTSGSPIHLQHVPPGAQIFLVARPAEILGSPEGQRVFKALGPQFESTRAAWEANAGVKLDDVEQVIVAWFSNQGKSPKVSVTVKMKQELNPDELRGKWGNASPVEGLAGVFQKGETAYYLPPADKRVLVIGPLDPEIKDVAEAQGKPPLLRREMGQLLAASDETRHVTLLFAPNFLFADGQEMFSGERGRALPALDWFLGDGLKAGMVSMHVGESFYFELRMESDIQLNKFQLATQVRDRLAEIPESVETQIAKINPHPYWRLVANRFPGMIRFLHQQSRIGLEGNQAMVNAVLPGPAAHNLVFGSEMMLASASGTPFAASGAAPAVAAASPKNIEEVLKSKVSISFAQDSLEFSMQNVASEVKSAYPSLPFEFAIKILGPDLEKDGITRNQQVRDFDQKDKTVAEILTAMVMKANPVTTVKAPNELDQKLIWVVAPDPSDATKQIVLVTTRAAAEQKKYTLPEVFRNK